MTKLEEVKDYILDKMYDIVLELADNTLPKDRIDTLKYRYKAYGEVIEEINICDNIESLKTYAMCCEYNYYSFVSMNFNQEVSAYYDVYFDLVCAINN